MKMEHYGYIIIMAFVLCAFVGCDEQEEVKSSAKGELRVSDYAALGSEVPHLVEHREQFYVFWRGRPQTDATQMNGFPRMPAELIRGSWRSGWNTVTYVNLLDAGVWSNSKLLVIGDVKCDPKFVWSDTRGLNLLVELGDSTCSHFLLDDATRSWKQVRHFPEMKKGVLVPMGIQQSGDILHVATFSQSILCYWRYDGRSWYGPVVIEKEVKFDGTWGYFRPRLAVTNSEDVHVVWNTQADPSHVVIREDEIILRSVIKLKPRMAKGDNIDVEVISGDLLLVAYQVDEEAPESTYNSIYVSRFVEGKWEEASAGPYGDGLVLGDPQLIAMKDEALLVWRHQSEVRKGGVVASGPTASFSVRNGQGVWTKPVIIEAISIDPIAGLDGGLTFYSLYCTIEGDACISWGNDSVYVRKLHRFVGNSANIE